MPVIHVYKTNHDFRRDARLSYKARGILAYIMSHEHKWEVHVETLVKDSDEDGRIAVQSALQELLKWKYATLETVRDIHGKVRGKQYVIYDVPLDMQPHRQAQNLHVGTDAHENRQSGNQSVGTDKQVPRQSGNLLVGQQESDVDASPHRQAGFPSDGFPDSQETCSTTNPDLRENQEEKTLTTFESSEGTAGSIPSGAAGLASAATPAPAKPKTQKVIKPLPPDDWLWQLLEEYGDRFDIVVLNDDDWWTDMANSLPLFTKEFVSLAFADLAGWLRTAPMKTPRNRVGWLKRMRYSLNYFYDNKFSRRATNGKYAPR